jgi:hypothetical protein
MTDKTVGFRNNLASLFQIPVFKILAHPNKLYLKSKKNKPLFNLKGKA